jgi:hypothetical protein
MEASDPFSWLTAQLDHDEMVAYRVLHWPDDTCQPPGRAILFRHDRWVRRHTWPDGVSSDQTIRTATAAEGQLPEDWESGRPVPEGWIGVHLVAQVNDVPYGPNMARWIGDHIALHDPARVLRDVAAHRAILSEHGSMLERMSWDEDLLICHRCRYDQGLDTFNWPCPTVRALVSIYADRPGYDPAWTVE